MHDGGGDRTQTILALEIILRELSGQGYTFRSLFGHGVEGAGSWE
jgi:peptidoglycan/xylan/chitin deacetylase (PgdA/CDA1 family)